MKKKKQKNRKRTYKAADRIGPARSTPDKLAEDQNKKRRK